MPTKSLQKSSASYQSLLNQIRKILIAGQDRIEEEKVRIYWKTGKHINRHILKYSKKPEYGAEVLAGLSLDLNVDRTTLYDCLKFAKAYPILNGRLKFKWSLYRELIRIPDEKTRKRLEEGIQTYGWTGEELIARIKQLKPVKTLDTLPFEKSKGRAPSKKTELLKPLRGELYHYKIIRRPNVKLKGQTPLRLDLGFRNFEKMSLHIAAQFREGDIVTSIKKVGRYRFMKVPNAGENVLYTYEAEIEKVIDGDTLKVCFDQGFGFERTEVLRLRGIDCPEMSTPAGVAARNFVLSYLKESQTILMRSFREEKYGRYLADVFILTPDRDSEKDIYLNNLLLESGHAVRM